MQRKVTLIIVCISLALCIVACAKKEEPAAQVAATPAKPVVTPGEMVLVPAGEFVFGSSEDKDTAAYPEQKINLPAFWIDKYEVTNAEFLNFSINSSYQAEGVKEGKDWRQFATPDKAKYPVLYITWNDSKAYCESLGKRLPTEEEWEKAARGTDGRRYPWGNTWDPAKTNTYESGTRNPGAVGEYGDISPYGAQDMIGNVQEWTSSWFKAYKGNPKKGENFGERFRVVRGASARMYGSRAHLWDRSAWLPKSLYDFGCRCAKDATPEEAAKGAATK